MRKKHHAYVVKWRDSATLPGWRPIDDGRADVAIITSIGWLAQETPRTVTLTTGISESGNILDPVTIPREAVTKMTRLKNYILGGE